MKGCVLPLNLFELIAYELDDSMETYNALRATNSAVKQAIDSSLFKRTFFYDIEKKSWNGLHSQRIFPKVDDGRCHVICKNYLSESYAISGLSLEDILFWVAHYYKEVICKHFTNTNAYKEASDELFEAIKNMPP